MLPPNRVQPRAKLRRVNRGRENVRRALAASSEQQIPRLHTGEQILERTHLVAAELRRSEVVALDPEWGIETFKMGGLHRRGILSECHAWNARHWRKPP